VRPSRSRKVDEDDAAVVAGRIHPATQRDGLADVLCADGVAVKGAEGVRDHGGKRARRVGGFGLGARGKAERAIGAARALVSREPKNADAKALLAAALDWQDDSCPETLASIEAALKLEARHPLALELLHARHIDKLLETAAFRRPALPGEKLPGDINRQLYDHPLSAEELAAFQQQKAMLERETEVLLENAYQRRDTAAFLRLVDDSLQLRIKEASAQASHQRDPGHSFEEFLGHTMMAYTWAVFSLFEKPERLKQAVDLAGKDSEALGTIFILGVGVRAMNAMKSGRSLSIEDHEMEDVIMSRLAEIARADDSTNAARASEAIGIAGMFSVMSGRPPVHPDLFFRALQLDPFRHRALGLLLGGCMAVDPTAISAAAVMEMQLAVLPNLWTRRQCAAAAAKLHDWDTVFRHLDACAREKPGDLMVLNQRVATTLRQSQSKASIKKAALYYDGITADNLLEKTKDLSNDDRLEFIENFFLHLVLRRENEVAQTLLNQIAEAGILGEKAVKEWQELLK
jgi:hypothetical protein